MKQVIKLTESDIHNIVRQVINEALNEMDKDVALYPTTIYKASDRMVTNGQYSSQNKKGETIKTNKVNVKSRKIADRAIMHYVIQEMKPWLSFRTEDKTYPNGHVGIEFEVKEIKEFSETQIQFYGYIVTANWKGYVKRHGTIKCVFGDKGKEGNPYDFKYYMVENYGNTTKTSSIELLGDPDNEKVIKDIIAQIYNLRAEAEANANSITDLSNFNLRGDLTLRPKKKFKVKKGQEQQPNKEQTERKNNKK